MAEDDGSAPRTAIGIAFGNSYSSIAFTNVEGKAEVIANEEGDRQIPSILSYVEGEEFQGTQAKNQLIRNPKNTVAYFRDFLGKEWVPLSSRTVPDITDNIASFKSIDPTPCHQSAHPREHASTVAFSVRDTEDDKGNIRTVSEITTRYLQRLKNSASDFLGKTVNAAVMTVPTNFTDKQKEALKVAAHGAGIEVLQFIHEPVAALLAYDAQPDSKPSDKIVVVADLGGTRSDVAVIASREGMYSILATNHDWDVSGSHLDQVLMNFFARDFIKKHKTDPRENERSLAKLKMESEAVKKSLSIGQSATFSVEALAEGIDFRSTINRTRFDILASKHHAAFTRLITRTVEKADLDLLDVDEIILAGGSSHVPRIAANVKATFPEHIAVLAPSTSSKSINPSHLIARGAAIQASLIQEFEAEDIEQSTHPMVTVTPHLSKAIGVLCISEDPASAVFRPLIAAETPVPARRTAQIAVPRDGGNVLVKVVEAEREIKVTKLEPKTNGKAEGHDDDDSDEDDFSDEEEEEEIRSKAWKIGRTIAEAGVRGTKKGSKVEVQVNVGADLAVQVQIREVGGKGGVRGHVQTPHVMENGKA